MGFDDIVIFTNLVRGREPRFLARVAELGRFTWRVSIQGGDAQTHDRVVGRPGAWAKIQSGLAWLGQRGHDLTANACINELSHRSVLGYVDLARSSGLSQLHLDMVRPGSTGARSEEHIRGLLARYSDMAVYLRQMLDAFDAWNPDFEVNVGNFPFCLLPNHAHRVVHGGQDTLTVTTDDRGDLGRVLDKYAYQGADKVLSEACEGCSFRASCQGVSAQYADIFGLDELHPFADAGIDRLDPRVRRWLDTGWRPGRAQAPSTADLLGIARVVRRLRRGAPWAGWTVAGVRASPDGGGAIVSLMEAGRSLDVAVATRPHLKVTFQPGAGTSTDEARGAIEAIAGALRGRTTP